MKEFFQKSKERGVRIRTINALMIVLAAAISLTLLSTMREMSALAGETGAAAALEALLARQRVLTALLLAIVVLTILSVVFLILWPMGKYISRIRAHKVLPMRGAYELRYLAEAYNAIYDENKSSSDKLRYEAEHDPLTGLYNRGAFERLRDSLEGEPVALLLLDVDKFKEVNDSYGHDVGDKILKKVALLLSHGFRSHDHPCRVGGDEFAVIMTDMEPALESVVEEKLRIVRDGLQDTSDGLPAATLSIGVAFSRHCGGAGEALFKAADAALYRVKTGGRDGCAFYSPEEE